MDSGIYFTDKDLEKFSLSDANSKLSNIDKMRWVDLHRNSGILYIYCNGLILSLSSSLWKFLNFSSKLCR